MTKEALTKVEPAVSLGMVQVTNPIELLAKAADIATQLSKVIKDKKLYKRIGDKDHVYCDGWTALIAMLGVTAHERETREIEGGVFVSTVELVTIRDGAVVGRASAQCGGPDEPDWHERPKYKWIDGEHGREKVLDGMEPVSANARRSMAQTRATSKACRLAFSWIMVLADYDPTPAEEAERMPGLAEEREQRRPASKPAPAPAAPADLAGRKVRRMKSKYAFACGICNERGAEGDEIAFSAKDGDTPALVAHWGCWESVQKSAAAAAAKTAEAAGNGQPASKSPF